MFSDTLGDGGAAAAAAAANDVDTLGKKPYGFTVVFFFFSCVAEGELLLLLAVIQSMFKTVCLSVLRQNLNASQWEPGVNAQNVKKNKEIFIVLRE